MSLSFIGTGTDPDGIRATRQRGGSQTTSQLTADTPIEWFVSPGSHQVTFEDIAPHCALWGSFPTGPRVDATVAAATTLDIEITLACFGDVFYELEFGLQVVSAEGVGTTLPFDGQPGGWSVDGTRFLWSARPLGNDDLYLFDVASGVETRITNDPADEYQPSWSPNGSQIVFIRDLLGTSDLVRINADGSGEVVLTDGTEVPGLGSAFRVLRLSDDREIRLLTEERRAFPRPSPAAVAR